MCKFTRQSLLVVAALALLGAGASVASASSVFLCVPATAGQAIVSGGSGATASCATDSTSVALPASAGDQQTLLSILAHASYTAAGVGGKPTITFTGVNVQLVSGAGSTTATPNGTGNLVIGYDENSSGRARTGSHNLIVGANHGWSSYSGIAAGNNNTTSGPEATALGDGNTASGLGAVAAGHNNQAKGAYTSVLGGSYNTANGVSASVTAGSLNVANNRSASITGGCQNLIGTGTITSLNGACDPANSPGSYDTITGGAANQITSTDSTITSGLGNLAADEWTSITGGCQNIAAANNSSQSAPYLSQCGNAYAARFASITGGWGNSASGTRSAISGGQRNLATGSVSSISGGVANEAVGDASSITGGAGNGATGMFSTISGGRENAVSTEGGSVLGGFYEFLNASAKGSSQAGPTLFAP